MKLFVSGHKYHNRKEFMHDIEQILQNCVQYNGQSSPYSAKAQILVKAAEDLLAEVIIIERTSRSKCSYQK